MSLIVEYIIAIMTYFLFSEYTALVDSFLVLKFLEIQHICHEKCLNNFPPKYIFNLPYKHCPLISNNKLAIYYMLDIININIYDYAFKEYIEKQTHKHIHYNIGHKKDINKCHR